VYTDGPDIARGPTEAFGIVGGEAELVCGTIRSNPRATIEWSDNNGNTVDRTDWRVSLTSSSAPAALSIRSLSMSDSGNWLCAIFVKGVRSVFVSIALTVIGEKLRHTPLTYVHTHTIIELDLHE
jgi:hypothetical protein